MLGTAHNKYFFIFYTVYPTLLNPVPFFRFQGAAVHETFNFRQRMLSAINRIRSAKLSYLDLSCVALSTLASEHAY